MKKNLIALALLGLGASASSHAISPTYHLVVPLDSVATLSVGSYTVSPSQLTFSAIQAGSSTVREILIQNTGKAAQNNPQFSITKNPGEFSVSHTCPEVLGAGASCTAQVTYTAAVTTAPGTLAVSFEPAGTKTVSLQGISTSDALTGGDAHSFGSVITGQTAAHTFTLRNAGTDATALSYGSLPTTITRSGDCGSSLAAGASCSLALTWAPTAAGALDHTFKVSGKHSDTSFRLTGTGVAAANLTADSSTQAFGNVILGQSAKKTITVTNSGEEATTLSYSALPAGMTKAGTCGSSLAGGASCTIELTWAPTASGSLSNTFVVTGQRNNASFPLTGTALTQASVSGGSTQAFGNVTVGQSKALTWTLTNSGQATANLTYGANLPATVTRSGTCGATLTGCASCTVILTWKPTAAGTLASTTFTAGGQNLVFSGTGVAASPIVAETIDTEGYCYQGGSYDFWEYWYPEIKFTTTAGVTLVDATTVSNSAQYAYPLVNQNACGRALTNTLTIPMSEVQTSQYGYQGQSRGTMTVDLKFSDGAVVRKTYNVDTSWFSDVY